LGENLSFAASWLARISCQRRGAFCTAKLSAQAMDFGVISTNSSSAMKFYGPVQALAMCGIRPDGFVAEE